MVALQNLRNAFPESNVARLESIALKSFQSVCITFLELIWLPMLSRNGVRQRVQIDNIELVNQLMNDEKGIIFLTAHFGSWELAIQAIMVHLNAPVCAIAKTQSNVLVDRAITRWREVNGLKTVPMGAGVREILRVLGQKGIVAMAADQSAAKESVAVEFFGRTVPTFQGPAVFSLKTGAPIVLGCTVRQQNGTYQMHLVHVRSDDLVGASEQNIRILTQRQVRATEEIIRKYPEQWMWMHKRWKHVPERIEGV